MVTSTKKSQLKVSGILFYSNFHNFILNVILSFHFFNTLFSAPISDIVIEGTNWIQAWEMLSLNVSCKGSGPFYKCLEFHRGEYNITGNETCVDPTHLNSCDFSIIHYFLEPSKATIVMILQNDVSTQIYPLTINIFNGKRNKSKRMYFHLFFKTLRLLFILFIQFNYCSTNCSASTSSALSNSCSCLLLVGCHRCNYFWNRLLYSE